MCSTTIFAGDVSFHKEPLTLKFGLDRSDFHGYKGDGQYGIWDWRNLWLLHGHVGTGGIIGILVNRNRALQGW